MADSGSDLAVELVAVVVAVTEDVPRVLTLGGEPALPAGPLQDGHPTLETGLRRWVEQLTHQPLGYVEQLYTFGDPIRPRSGGRRTISLSYLGLAREEQPWGARDAVWRDWYDFFPWEDQRGGNRLMADQIEPRLSAWAAAPGGGAARARALRCALMFGLGGRPWNEEFALQRYELLYEAGLVPEAVRDRGAAADHLLGKPGRVMAHDHRRILATGLSRLRAKIRYRPVVFELLPDSFTLLQLQLVVEALAGQTLHKQNFRRLVDQQALVEDTGSVQTGTGGRPARLVRFRREVLQERAMAGTRPAAPRSP